MELENLKARIEKTKFQIEDIRYTHAIPRSFVLGSLAVLTGVYIPIILNSSPSFVLLLSLLYIIFILVIIFAERIFDSKATKLLNEKCKELNSLYDELIFLTSSKSLN